MRGLKLFLLSFSPTRLIWVFGGVALGVFSLWLFGQHQYKKGYQAYKTEIRKEVERLQAGVALRESLLKEQGLRLGQWYEAEKAKKEDDFTDLLSRLGSGDLRLYVNPISTDREPQDAIPTGNVDGAARCEFSQADANALLRIARDGDRAIEQLTALQRWVEGQYELLHGDSLYRGVISE